MSNNQESMIFVFETILRVLAKEIYDNPLASLRENLQNSVDAIRVRKQMGETFNPAIEIKLNTGSFEIIDNGNGMSRKDLHTMYWAVGKSGKSNLQDICIGTFGVGALANFGMATDLEVTSRLSKGEKWVQSSLSWEDIRRTPEGSTPKIRFKEIANIPGINDKGTIVKVNFLAALDDIGVKEAHAYISNHVAGLDIPVTINGSVVSGGNWYAIPQDYLEQEKGYAQWKIFNEDINISYTVYENKQGELAVKFTSTIISGISLPSKRPSTIFKRGFKLCDYQPDSAIPIQFHLLVDCWYFSPTAGRDTLSPSSAKELDNIILSFGNILLLAASKSNQRVRALHGIFEMLNWYWDSKQDKYLDNLIVHQIIGDDKTLHEIHALINGTGKAAFYTTQVSRSALALAGRGHTVVLLPSDHFEQQCITNYLKNEYKAKDINLFEAIQQVIPIESLSDKENSALFSLRHDLAEFIGDPKVSVVPATLKEDIMFYWPENRIDEVETIYCNIRHNHIVNVLNQTGIAKAEMLWDLLMVEMGEQVIRARRLAFGKDDASIEALIANRYRLYQLSLQDIQRISSREPTTVTISDIQIVDADSDREIMHKKIVIIDGKSNQWRGGGCYLRLEPMDHEDLKPIRDLYENLDIWVTGNVVNYYIRYGRINMFKLSLEFDHLINYQSTSYEVVNKEIDERRRLLFLEQLTYIPVPQNLEPYIVPNSEKRTVKFLVRAKPFYPKES